MITNRQIYQMDPSARKLVNEGVANVNDERTSHALEVLRYELETFVCDGQYERGMELILETYLKNIDQAQQPSVWVSGFYGSGKSHLVKMLRALWLDTPFDDGATARGVAVLSQNVRDLLKELATQGKRHGGLFAASGTLGSGAEGSVRLALLGVVFKAAGLPVQYHLARFVMWLRHEGIYEEVKTLVERNGFDWQEELDNFYVAEGLHEALVKVKPKAFPSVDSCIATLNNLYPYVTDVNNDEMLKTLRRALAPDGRLPLTLIVLDEVQQYIGGSSERSIAVQEMVESITKNIGGKLMFVGTGQTAVTGTANLARLQGRFTVRVELSDADVDAVIRKVVLAKKAEFQTPLEDLMRNNMGEISRHLAGTAFAFRERDRDAFPRDYPVLPVRRRFWENVLRVLDVTGTDSQLRNQLSMVHKAIQSNLDAPLGCVVPADYLYFDSADKMLQTRILPRKLYEQTMTWRKGSEDERLKARACALVFLVNKLNSVNHDVGIKANADALADLLVEDLSQGSASLRAKLPSLLEGCALLMKVGDEYRIQTEESAAWNDEFLNQRAQLSDEAHRVDTERDNRIRAKCTALFGKISPVQGISKVPRAIDVLFDPLLPNDAGERLYVWVRDGWSADENSVRADARQAGNSSPTVFVFLPRRSADELRNHLIDCKSAAATLERRGVPKTPEGTEARAAMETIRQGAEHRISELLEDVFSGARVFQGGGNEVLGNDLRETVLEAASNAMQRLFSRFQAADHQGWAKVFEQARKGAPDALKAVGYDGEACDNPVCKAILGFIAAGKKGGDIRKAFEDAPFGWSRDAVDGALLVLLLSGLLRGRDESGKLADPKELERKNIGKALFSVESTTVTAEQRTRIRKLFQRMGMHVKDKEESFSLPLLLNKLEELAKSASGEPPAPERPDISFLEELRGASGNEQLVALYNIREDIEARISEWNTRRTKIEERMPGWNLFRKLSDHALPLPDSEAVLARGKIVEQQRRLLDDPDPVAPLVSALAQQHREKLGKLKELWDAEWAAGEKLLQNDENWMALDPEDRNLLRKPYGLVKSAFPVIKLESPEAILESLENAGLIALGDRIAAMPGRYKQLLFDAAKRCEPEVQPAKLPGRVLKNEAEIDLWLRDAGALLKELVKKGPVSI